MLFISVVCK